MSENPTPLWRCNACDKQFEEPESWPSESHFRYEKFLDDQELAAETMKVCPRCHSTKIERWQ